MIQYCRRAKWNSNCPTEAAGDRVERHNIVAGSDRRAFSFICFIPYNETKWEVPGAERIKSRKEQQERVNHAKATLMAGFTTVEEISGRKAPCMMMWVLKRAIEKGVIPGPRMIVATRAIVAKGTYAPGEWIAWCRVAARCREEVGAQKIYDEPSDHRLGMEPILSKSTPIIASLNNDIQPTFSQSELEPRQLPPRPTAGVKW